MVRESLTNKMMFDTKQRSEPCGYLGEVHSCKKGT